MKKIDHVILSGTKCSRRISTCLFFSVLLALLAGCDDSSSASAENSEPAALSSAEKQGSSSSGSETLSSSSRCAGASEECDEAISSDSNAESNGSSRSSSSEKNAESSCSEELSETSSSSADEIESSSGESDVSQNSAEAKVVPSGTYDCTKYKCVTTEYLNQKFLEAGKYGEILDERDNQVYKTVQIGEQIWMAENLNYETDNSFCYNSANCSKYGRLYTWAAATAACPEGWHLPSDTEIETLITAVGGSYIAGAMLKAQTGWTAYDGIANEDAFGFSALPAGTRADGGRYYYGEGLIANFWCSTEYDSDHVDNMGLEYYDDYALLRGNGKNYGFSVRCVKD